MARNKIMARQDIKIREELFTILSRYLMQGVEPMGIVRYVICNDFYSLAEACKSPEDFAEAQRIYEWLQINGTVDGIRAWGNKAIMYRYLDVAEQPLNTK